MRARLAVFLAAVVVFAPGWGSEQFAGGKRPSAEVGARMLAPTFDEAAERGGSFLKRLDRLSPTGEPNKLVPWASSTTAPNPPMGVLLTALIVLALLSATDPLRSRTERAPPHLLTV